MMLRLLICLGVLGALTACGDPMNAVPKLSDVAVSDDAAAIVAEDGDTLLADIADGAPAPEVAPLAPAPRGGLFGFLRARGTPTDPAAATEATNDEAPATTRAGFFGRRATAPISSGIDGRQVQPGERLEFGEIATNCAVRGPALGSKIGERGGFAVYDTGGNATLQRTHYITGFQDGCARQFTAALALMGDVGTHEVVRYMPANKEAYSATDTGYEAIKAAFCGAGQGQPCGRKLDQLDKVTAYISVYRQFGTNQTWSEILVHQGAVIAMADRRE